jgi:hypothetical protein
MSPTICIISTSPSVDKEVAERIRAALPNSIKVRKRIYFQATAIITPEVIEIVFILVGSYIGKGFLEELGKDAYRKLKDELGDFLSKKGERTLAIQFKSKKTRLSFRLETDEKSVVDSALKKIPQIISETEKSTSFYLGPQGQWEKFEGKVEFVGEGVAMTTGEFELNGRKVKITERDLRDLAENMLPNFPIMHEHRGRPIGKLTKSWVRDGKLRVRYELYKPRNATERQVIEAIRSGDLRGFSLGFSSAQHR